MSSKTVVAVGVIAFLAPFGVKTAQYWLAWQKQVEIKPYCDYNLKALWVVARQCSVRYRLPFPPPLPLVQDFADSGQSVLITEKIANYLGLPYMGGGYTDFRGTLICAQDPDYLLKIAKMTQGLPYEPSYRWCPDERTLAECPYCHIAVLLDGRIERRER